MKAFVLFIFLLVFNTCFSQHFATDSSKWHMFFSWTGTDGPGEAYISNNNIFSSTIGDTIVGLDTLQIIHQVNETLTPTYSIHEKNYFVKSDSNIIYSGGYVDSLEMLYNFNLEVTDTFVQKIGFGIYTNESDTPTVIEVDTIYIGGKMRKRIVFDRFSSYISEHGNYFLNRKGMMWVEGIGDLNHGLGLNSHLRYNFFYDWKYECFSEYEIPIFGNCAPLNISHEEKSSISVYPNPANEKISIEWSDTETTAFYIYDLNGKLISIELLTSGKNIIDISYFNPGVYIGIATSSQSVYKEKIIVQ